MTAAQYIVLKQKLHALLAELRQGREDVARVFLQEHYPDIQFSISSNTQNTVMSFDLIDADRAETQVVADALNQYFRDLDDEAKKGDICTIMDKNTR